MLYDNDVSYLLTLWKERVSTSNITQEYKDAVRDCMYDVKVLADKNKQYLKFANLMLGSDHNIDTPVNTPSLSSVVNSEAAAYLSPC